MKGILLALGTLALVSSVGAWYWRSAGDNGTTYRTASLERGNLLATISATGTLEPEEVIDIGAQVAGQIKHFGRDPRDNGKAIDYGSVVEEGTVLAQIDAAVYKAQADQARANLQRAEADLLQMQAKLHQAEREWKRARELRPRKIISETDYDLTLATYETSRSVLAVGEAGVAQARAALQQAETNLSYTTIRSPVKGVIIDRRVNVGQTVVASLNAPSLFLIAKDLTRMQIWAAVNEADIGQIHPGQVVRFTVDAFPNQVFRGEVGQIRLNATMTQNVVNYTVVVNTENANGKLLPYMTANLSFEVSQRTNVLLVANSALRWRPQLQQVAPDVRESYAKSLRQRRSATEDKQSTSGDKERSERATLWVEDAGFVRPIKIYIGQSDGVMTEVVDGAVQEGVQVVIGEVRQNSERTTNPFTPQLRAKKGQ